jgi:hypothetical protein
MTSKDCLLSKIAGNSESDAAAAIITSILAKQARAHGAQRPEIVAMPWSDV